jgi:hypothetical protein
MNTDLSQYTRGLIGRATPAVWRAYHQMRAQGLSDHLIVVVFACGKMATSLRPREEFWAELKTVIGGRVELPQSPPTRPPGKCWVVFLDDEAPEGGCRLQLAGFDGEVGPERLPQRDDPASPKRGGEPGLVTRSSFRGA